MRKLICFFIFLFLFSLAWADNPTDTTTPTAAYEKFYTLLSQKNYPEAYKLLSTPTRQAFESMSKILKQIQEHVSKLPDSNLEKPMAQKILETLSNTDGPTLFAQIMKISVPEPGTLPPYQPPIDMKTAGTLATGHTAKGFPITLYKENNNWMVDLNSGALNAQCVKLEEYLQQLGDKGK